MITYFSSDGGRFLVIADYRLAAMPLLFVGFVAICCALLATVATFITNGGGGDENIDGV